LLPAGLREYTGGESLSRIDWKATARLVTPHVREFDVESDITTVLIIDRRGRLDTGPPGETAFEYLRSSALSYLTVIESLGDPVGCFTVDQETIKQVVMPTNSTHGYDTVRRRLQGTDVDTTAKPKRRTISLNQRSPMLDRETTFGRTLASYTNKVVATPSTEPLPQAVRRAGTAHQGTVQLAVFTDDSDHVALRDAVTEAKRNNVRLNVFIAPQALYETPTASDRNAINERYREFERFRRQLAAIDGVTAYEVAPKERIERVLRTKRPRV
jgi:uncharacterized protein (DUF58 family)